MELYNLKNFTTYAMVAGPGIYAKLQAKLKTQLFDLTRNIYLIGKICNTTSTNLILNSNVELCNLKNFTTYAMVAGPGIYAKLQPNHYVMIWVHYTLLLPLQQK